MNRTLHYLCINRDSDAANIAILVPQFLIAQTYLFRCASFTNAFLHVLRSRKMTWRYNTRSNLCCITYERYGWIHKCEIIVFYEFIILFLLQDKLLRILIFYLFGFMKSLTWTNKPSFLALSCEIYARLTPESAEFSALLAKYICVILTRQLLKSRSLFRRKHGTHRGCIRIKNSGIRDSKCRSPKNLTTLRSADFGNLNIWRVWASGFQDVKIQRPN